MDWALGLGLLAAAGAAALFWPRGGLVERARRLWREAERVRLEDGLKHLLDCERGGRGCTLENLAGRLEVSRGVASEVLTRLTDRGLAAHGPAGFGLTEAGRTYALRILRTHRLWERYLADRTGVPAGQWHAEAERVEHRLTEEEAERLASRLGHPRYDPHGDPIPTARGDIPAPAGVPLTQVEGGGVVRVVHVEDEPGAVFDRLTAAGVAPGLTLEVVGRVEEAAGAGGTAPERAEGEPGEGVGDGRGGFRIRARGRSMELRAVDAANVTVERLAPDAAVAPSAPRRTLEEVAMGEAVEAVAIAPECQGPQRRRLLDLGVVPGTRIVPELVSASGDPVAYRIRGALVALRREQASWIEVTAEAKERVG